MPPYALKGARKGCVSKAPSDVRLLFQPPTPCLLLLSLVHVLLLLPGTIAEDLSPISPLTRFDAKGQLPQSDAAARAVARGGPLVALSLKEAVLLVAPSERRPRSLIENRGLPKMWRLTDGICLSHVGLIQDSRALLLAAQQAAFEHENRFGEHIPIAELVEVVAGKQQEATMQGSRRPYGSSILIAGLLPDLRGPASIPTSSSSSDSHRRKGVLYPRIYRTDPSGTFTLWRACALGRGTETIMALLEDKYAPEMERKEALKLALECCRVLMSGGREKREEKLLDLVEDNWV